VARDDLQIDGHGTGGLDDLERSLQERGADATRSKRRFDVELFQPRGPLPDLNRKGVSRCSHGDGAPILPREQDDPASGVGEHVVERRGEAVGRGRDVVLSHLRDEKRDRRVAVGRGGPADVHRPNLSGPRRGHKLCARAARLGLPAQGESCRSASSRRGPLARPLHCRNAMNGTDELEKNENDDDLFGGWFEQGEGEAAESSEEACYEEVTGRGSRVGVVIAAVSATALTLVLVLAGHV